MKTRVLKSVYLDVETVERLRELSQETRIPQSAFVREGIEMLLQKYEGGESETTDETTETEE